MAQTGFPQSFAVRFWSIELLDLAQLQLKGTSTDANLVIATKNSLSTWWAALSLGSHAKAPIRFNIRSNINAIQE